MRSSGPGGQHANKNETAVQLRFDIGASSLSEMIKTNLLSEPDKRITDDGILILKSAKFRSQQKNKDAVVARLYEMVEKAGKPKKRRKPTKPTKASKEERRLRKSRRSDLKQLRKKVTHDE